MMKPSDHFFIELCYRKFAADGPMAPTLLWPKIQSAGQPWTSAKIKTGIFLLKQLDQAQKLLNTATKSFINQKSANSYNNEEEEGEVVNDDGDEEWIDVSSDEDASDSELEDEEENENGCKFLSLSKYLNNDAVAQENLQKLESISTDMRNGDLLNIINEYQPAFEGFLYIAKAIQMEKYLEEIQKVSDEIPEELAKIQESSALDEDINDGHEHEDESEEEEGSIDDDEDDSDSDGEEFFHFMSHCLMSALVPPEDEDESDAEFFHFMFHCMMNASHPHGGLWN